MVKYRSKSVILELIEHFNEVETEKTDQKFFKNSIDKQGNKWYHIVSIIAVCGISTVCEWETICDTTIIRNVRYLI